MIPVRPWPRRKSQSHHTTFAGLVLSSFSRLFFPLFRTWRFLFRPVQSAAVDLPRQTFGPVVRRHVSSVWSGVPVIYACAVQRVILSSDEPRSIATTDDRDRRRRGEEPRGAVASPAVHRRYGRRGPSEIMKKKGLRRSICQASGSDIVPAAVHPSTSITNKPKFSKTFRSFRSLSHRTGLKTYIDSPPETRIRRILNGNNVGGRGEFEFFSTSTWPFRTSFEHVFAAIIVYKTPETRTMTIKNTEFRETR